MAKRGQVEINSKDPFYVTLRFVGLGLILFGMILIALPLEGTLYRR